MSTSRAELGETGGSGAAGRPVVLWAGGAHRWAEWRGPLERAFDAAGLDVALVTEADPERVDWIVYAPKGPLQDFRPYRRAKAVLNIWAGVEEVVDNPTLTQPLARMVDTGLAEGMTEWVLGHVLRHHLGMDAHICRQDPVWEPVVPPLARDRSVGVLGLGELGGASAKALAAAGFEVAGWSRSAKKLEGVTCHHGDAGFADMLSGAEIVVALLPLTAATEGVLDAAAFAAMPEGAVLLNPGRGGLIDEAALLAALDAGHLGHATLDVFRTEPLPEAHPFWAHPRVTVTPHIASQTRPESAARVIAENVRRGEAGLPLRHLVNRQRGY